MRNCPPGAVRQGRSARSLSPGNGCDTRRANRSDGSMAPSTRSSGHCRTPGRRDDVHAIACPFSRPVVSYPGPLSASVPRRPSSVSAGFPRRLGEAEPAGSLEAEAKLFAARRSDRRLTGQRLEHRSTHPVGRTRQRDQVRLADDRRSLLGRSSPVRLCSTHHGPTAASSRSTSSRFAV